MMSNIDCEGCQNYQELNMQYLLGRPPNNIEKKHAPKKIYAAGPLRLTSTQPKVSVIGTRRPSTRGMREARHISGMLADNGVIVVSGLAAGVDTIAHRTAITHGGKTMAVLGTPLNKTYPAQNHNLQQDIMERHLAISQFPVGDDIQRGNFVRRNYTMALVSDATIIVEAGNASGTRHQGREALRLGRPLYLCKAVVEANPVWLDDIIQDGAKPLVRFDNILSSITHKTNQHYF